ncbi:MAG: DUF5996 family protein [Acidobacteriota bacterium]
MSLPNRSRASDWPSIPYSDWVDTCTTLHLWAQIVGKIRMVQTPWTNHSWHVPLYVTTRGLGTSPIAHGARSFDIDFDFIDHQLVVRTAEGDQRHLALEPRSVADFYQALMALLDELELPVTIHTTPNEIADAVPFDQDTEHASYDGEAARRFWRALVQVDRVLEEFRAQFHGKHSPVHFFWGSFDLAATRFSGREAPPHPGGVPNFPDWVAREAYSHEVWSAGFWAGGGGVDEAMFYAYAYPKPDGLENWPIEPAAASWHADLGEFVLPYAAVAEADSPDEVLLEFLTSSYDAAAGLAEWDREALDFAPHPDARTAVEDV